MTLLLPYDRRRLARKAVVLLEASLQSQAWYLDSFSNCDKYGPCLRMILQCQLVDYLSYISSPPMAISVQLYRQGEGHTKCSAGHERIRGWGTI